MRVGILYSGGKDSTYAAYLASQRDQLKCAITVFPPDELSFMFHFPNLRWTRLQCEAMGLPQVVEQTAGVKEEELADLSRAMATAKSRHGIEGVYTGALASIYQKSRVERVCGELGLACISPLWQVDPEAHLKSLLEANFTVMVVSVSALGLDESWLGRVIDAAAVEELVSLAKRYRFHIGLEGGEGETMVLDCPIFRKRIQVLESARHWRGDSGTLEITKAELVEKTDARAAEAGSRAP